MVHGWDQAAEVQSLTTDAWPNNCTMPPFLSEIKPARLGALSARSFSPAVVLCYQLKSNRQTESLALPYFCYDSSTPVCCKRLQWLFTHLNAKLYRYRFRLESSQQVNSALRCHLLKQPQSQHLQSTRANPQMTYKYQESRDRHLYINLIFI